MIKRVGAVESVANVVHISRQADAAIATSAALNVTEPSSCGIGGSGVYDQGNRLLLT